MSGLKSPWKSILVGGTAAGLVSLVPIVNLLNLFFMLWMAVGGSVTVYVLSRDNKEISISDSLLTGALSGFWGCLIFGTFIFTALSRLSPEKIERAASLIRAFFPEMADDMTRLFQDENLISLTFTVIGLLMLFSLVMGAVGGLITRSLIADKKEEEHDQ